MTMSVSESVVFGSIPQPAYMPCEECGASVPVGERDEHVCSERRRLEYRLFQLRAELAVFEVRRKLLLEHRELRPELAVFEEQFAAYLESPQGRFALWYAERERRLKRA